MASAWTPPPQEDFRRKKPILILSLGLVILGAMTFIWYNIRTKTDQVDEANLPVITSGQQPFKIKPVNPGGEVTPHADKTVYELISRHKGNKKTMMMKEEDEEPLSAVRATSEPEPVVPPQETVIAAPSPQESSSLEGAYKVQLASLSSEDAAHKEWNKLKKKNGELLANQKMSIIGALVNGKKVFRVYAGAFATKAQADQWCKLLAAKGVACLAKRA